MTKDEILTLYSYCQTHGVRKVDRLKELGISYYNLIYQLIAHGPKHPKKKQEERRACSRLHGLATLRVVSVLL